MIFREEQIFKPKKRHTKAVSDYQFLIQSMQRSKNKQHQYKASVGKQSISNQRNQKSMLSSYSHYQIRPSSKNQKLLNCNKKTRNLEIPNVKRLNDSDHQQNSNYQMEAKHDFENKSYRAANIVIPNVQRLDSSKIPLFQSISPQERKDKINIKKHMEGFFKKNNQEKQRYSLKGNSNVLKSSTNNGVRATSNLQYFSLDNRKEANLDEFIENVNNFLEISSVLFDSCSQKGRLMLQAQQLSGKLKKECKALGKKQASVDYDQWVQQKQIKQKQATKNADNLLAFNSQDYLKIISQLQIEKQKLSQLISQHERKNIKMYIQLNQGQSKEIQKYKKQLGSLYQSYKKLQAMLLSKSKNNNDLMMFVEKIKQQFEKRCRKLKELKRQNQQMRNVVQSCICQHNNVNDENSNNNISKDNTNLGKGKSCKQDTTKKCKNRSKDKAKQFNLMVSTKHSQIDQKIASTNMQNKTLQKQLSQSKQKLKELGQIVNQQNAQLEKMYEKLKDKIQKEKQFRDSQLKFTKRIGQLQKKERQSYRKIQKMRKDYQQLFQQVQSSSFPLFGKKTERQSYSQVNSKQQQNLYRILITQADSIEQLLIGDKICK